jgi:hypothetical protein
MAPVPIVVRAPIDRRASRALIKQGDRVSSDRLLTTLSPNGAVCAANRAAEVRTAAMPRAATLEDVSAETPVHN